MPLEYMQLSIQDHSHTVKAAGGRVGAPEIALGTAPATEVSSGFVADTTCTTNCFVPCKLGIIPVSLKPGNLTSWSSIVEAEASTASESAVSGSRRLGSGPPSQKVGIGSVASKSFGLHCKYILPYHYC